MTGHPRLLVFDTSGPHCAAALMLGDTVTVRIDEMAKGQAEHLMPMLQEMLRGAGLDFRDLDAIGVGVGPGNFTGIRISVSAARGLALGMGKPAIGVSTLEALAYGATRPVLAVADARQNRIYLQVFEEECAHDPVMVALEVEAIRNAVPVPDPVVIGALAEDVAALTGWHAAEPLMPLPEAIARQAAGRLEGPHVPPAPLYLRPADAAPARDTAPVILP